MNSNEPPAKAFEKTVFIMTSCDDTTEYCINYSKKTDYYYISGKSLKNISY